MTLNPAIRDEILRVALGGQDFGTIYDIVNDGILTGRVVTPSYQSSTPVYAGGTNFCPNSDFSWSNMAATTAGILPSTAGDTNYEVYRVFRQQAGANIGAERVRSDGHSSYAADENVHPWIPRWDRVQGNIHLGWDGGSGNNYDIAIEMTNNWLQNNRYRYVRIACATAGDTPLPVGAKLFVGYWVKRTGGVEEWVDGDGFTISYRRHAPVGTKHLQYVVLAKTGAGLSMVSSVLDVTDAPEVLDSSNYIEISYTGGSGFVEFLVYRKDHDTGQVDLISRDTNADQLWAYDIGTSLRVEPAGFPTGDLSVNRAYAEVALDTVPYSQQLTYHDLRIRVPEAFDTNGVLGVYLRIGLVGAVTENSQLVVDTVWESDSFNVWSPSAFDSYPSGRSTTLSTAPPSGGTNPTDHPPVNGGLSCLWVEHEIQTTHGWEKLKHVEESTLLVSGSEKLNVVLEKRSSMVSQWFIVEFSHGLVLRCTGSHRFARSTDDHSGVQVCQLRTGDTVIGGDGTGDFPVTVVSRTLVSGDQIEVAHLRHTNSSPNKLHRSGNSESGLYVYTHNAKSSSGL